MKLVTLYLYSNEIYMYGLILPTFLYWGGGGGEEGRGVEGGVEAGADISIQAVSEGWPDRRAAATTSTPRHFHIIIFHISTISHFHTSTPHQQIVIAVGHF